MISALENLYFGMYRCRPLSVVKLAGDGSNRVYYRLVGDAGSVVGVVGTSVEENKAFIAVAKAFVKSMELCIREGNILPVIPLTS